MRIEFFKANKDHNDSRTNSKFKIWFGIFFIACGFMIVFTEYTSVSESFQNGMRSSGQIFRALLTLLYVSFGRWISSTIFYFIGGIFIIWGIRDRKKYKINAS